jgi:ubiquinone/menaquinone biosynthesis C-methylase UbiE
MSLLGHNNLEEFSDPENYDLEEAYDTGIAFFTALARETGGPVLELACGTGRVSIPIAQQGFEVTGVDLVPGMLAQARRKSAGLPIRWVEGDARTIQLGSRYKLIFLTGNAFQAFLTRSDQEALLARVREHLQPEGFLAFETRNPRWGDLMTQTEEQEWKTYQDKHGRQVRMSETYWYEHVRQLLHWTVYRRWQGESGEEARIGRITVRYTFPQELEALLHYNGFEIVRQYGDWEGGPLTAISQTIITVSRLLGVFTSDAHTTDNACTRHG